MSLVACALIAGFAFCLLLLRVAASTLDDREARRVRVPVRARRYPHRG
ncbi:hypothetical protein [Nocardia sp. NBC_00416]